ncbi:MAG: DUF4955 domain-containing protein [Carboxylicivirga sp.]|jgi:hypothetical protein|nr:DUF4955 domain-containing protein [Carboxylicivirga sp.]
MKISTYLIVLITISIGAMHSKAQNVSQLFEDYRMARQNSTEPILPDFSFAGYKHGSESIPNVNYKLFDVTSPEFGAIPNDGLSDKVAIEAAIDAAEANGSGIVFFPPGKYLVNEPSDPHNQPITITKGNIVLRGSGSGSNGTELFMNRHMDPTDPQLLYSSPFLFNFKELGSGSKLTDVTANSSRESFSITVADASNIQANQWVMLYLQDTNPQAVAEALAPKTLEPEMTSLSNGGVSVREIHQVESVNGNVITFKEPIHKSINSNYNWELWSHKYLENIGIEDIAFTGNFTQNFDHHGSFYDDSGWSCVNLMRVVNSWITDCKFTNWSQVANFTLSANCTAILNTIEGNGGHTAIKAHGSTHILIGLSEDNASQWHSFGASAQGAGNVMWRVKWPANTSYESHASQPYATLFDKTEGGLIYGRWGGSLANQPNHLSHLVFWNFKNTAPVINNFEFWRTSSIWGRTLPPIISGFHGNLTTFGTNQVQENESWGQAVDEESLYEEQLKLRLGQLPDWLVKAKAKAGLPVSGPRLKSLSVDGNAISGFDQYKTKYRVITNGTLPLVTAESENPDDVVVVNQALSLPGVTSITVTDDNDETVTYTISLELNSIKKETFTNYTVKGWSKGFFDGNHDVQWYVNGKKANYLGSGNCLYFYNNTTGAQSDIFEDGVDSLSVRVKGLWNNTDTQIVELLVNDNVVKSSTHIGTDTYVVSAGNLAIKGDAKIAVRNASNAKIAIAIDDISWLSSPSDYNAHLSDIKVNGNSLSDFNRSTTLYSVALETPNVTIEATPESDVATVEVIEPSSGYPGTAAIKVTAEDGSTKSYQLAISFPDAGLNSIIFDGLHLNNFDTQINDYTVLLDPSTASVPSITAQLSNPQASLSITNATQVPGTTKLIVTASDGITKKEYNIHLVKGDIKETFTNFTTTSYNSGTFNGDNNQIIEYTDAQLSTSVYTINGNTMALRANSKVIINEPLGVGSISFQLTRYWYGSNSNIRQLEVLINGNSVGTCHPIGGDSNKYIYSIKDINTTGSTTIEIKHLGGEASAADAAVAIDNITWTKPAVYSSFIGIEEDTYIESGTNSTINYGTANKVVIRSNTGTTKYDRQSFMKFDLSSLNAEAIVNAKLVFSAKNKHGYNYSFFKVSNDNWDENTMTWLNQPTAGDKIGQLNVYAPDIAWFEMDLTDYIQHEFNGDKIVSLKIMDDQFLNLWSMIESKESNNSPYLNIEYTDSNSFSNQGTSLKVTTNMVQAQSAESPKLQAKLIPNPVAQGELLNLVLSSGDAPESVIIYDINGKTCSQIKPNSFAGQITIETNTLKRGIYIALIKTANRNLHCKFIVK